MTARAHCHRCDWTVEGSIEDADKASDAHTHKTGHPTAVIITPAPGVREIVT